MGKLLSLLFIALAGCSAQPYAASVRLPEPRVDGPVSVEAALAQRRSVRSYGSKPLSLVAVGQLLWSAQGVTHALGYRTAPSAGALYPLEVYLVARRVEDLAPGVYHYRAGRHTLRLRSEGDRSAELARAALRQDAVRDAAAVLVFAAVKSRTANKYGAHAMRYILLEVGHAAQNVLLQVQSLNLAAAVIGAFHDDEVKALLAVPEREHVLYLLPVGHPR